MLGVLLVWHVWRGDAVTVWNAQGIYLLSLGGAVKPQQCQGLQQGGIACAKSCLGSTSRLGKQNSTFSLGVQDGQAELSIPNGAQPAPAAHAT